MSAYVPMLRCVVCLVPVMVLTPEQVARRKADPARYRYVCTSCERGDADDADGD